MKYRTDPKSGNQLSILGFGCMRFPRGINAKIDKDKTEKLVLSAIERGVNYFDTAHMYGASEETLGEILDKNDARDKIFLATKLPHRQCKGYEDFDKFLTEQLTRLKTGCIDYYLIHNLPDAASWEGLCGLGIKRWIKEIKASGKIKQIGFSFHGAQNEFFALLDAYEWDFCQIQYNYMNENFQAGQAGLLKAHEKGLPIIVMEPLLGGKLATGLPKKAVKLFNGAGSGLSEAAWAMRWLWNQPQVTVVLSGMNSADQLADNLKTAEDAVPGLLSDQESRIVSEVVSVVKEAYKIPCTGCNYCMPCHRGVNIPGIFAAYNSSYALGFVAGITQYMTSMGGMAAEENNYSGRNCIKCGRCEKLCPQHIEISKCLEAATKRMEPFWANAAFKLYFALMK